MTAHTTVLLSEAVEELITDRDGYYIDCTFGRGGHSQKILDTLSPNAHLLAFDKDPDAVSAAKTQLAQDARFEIVQGSFTQLAVTVKEKHLQGRISGVLLDLGVSSPQLDNAGRGFSFQNDGPLDMRMDSTRGMSAADWINAAKESEIMKVIKEYGDEKFAKRIARNIVTVRDQSPIDRTVQLAQIVADAHPAWEVGKHPATKTFLAIRLYINQELEDLTKLLNQVLDVLKPGGRLVVISFHSLEDRIVKRFIRDKARGDVLLRGLPIPESQLNRTLKSLGKAIKPSAQEIERNVRSRSAIMRVAEKLDVSGESIAF